MSCRCSIIYYFYLSNLGTVRLTLITILSFMLKYNFWFESVTDLKVLLIFCSENIFKNNLRDLVLKHNLTVT